MIHACENSTVRFARPMYKPLTDFNTFGHYIQFINMAFSHFKRCVGGGGGKTCKKLHFTNSFTANARILSQLSSSMLILFCSNTILALMPE